MFGYAKNPDIPLRIQGSLLDFASVLQFLAQPFELHHFGIQTYV